MNEKTFSDIKANALSAKDIIISLTAPTAGESIDPVNLQALKQHITSQTTLLNAINNRSDSVNANERVPFTINLDAAVDALKDMKSEVDYKPNNRERCDNSQNKPDKSQPETEEPIKQVGSMMTGSHSNERTRSSSQERCRSTPRRFNNRRDKKGYIPSETGPKRNSYCTACGGKNHWRGDPECPGSDEDDDTRSEDVAQDIRDLRGEINRRRWESSSKKRVRFPYPDKRKSEKLRKRSRRDEEESESEADSYFRD
ncbi:unnamed protein product [Chondrus crispus]|uniref:Uncharacterized protein n=1 Tax=Chondrus crispus TaxID=2769 RepID=R7Q726_CHOCR|nr:unnamed protein product [Chondrus crispus]CDF33829.1 unnamed protein product [Chondrus crispus]|eukprot:XP_005713648.1 unnamed protein product [Chondrus crispus]